MMIFDDYAKWMEQEAEAKENLEALRPQVLKALKTLAEMHEKEKELIRQEHERERGARVKKIVARVSAVCVALGLNKNQQDDIIGAVKKRDAGA